MVPSISRREFIGGSTLAAAGALTGCATSRRRVSANDKLNVAVIGVAAQGEFNLNNVAHENIVALCDVDDQRLAKAASRFPAAKTYHDFRRLIDQRDIDAIVVATPDHTHAVAASAALRSGRHCYCEKPLTRTVSETRRLIELARRHRAVTQMGTQIHAQPNYRRVVELIQSGAIGTVREVDVWVGGGFGDKEWPANRPPVPGHLHYDQWLGPVEPVPYSPDFVPFHWRHYWHFGGGTLADLGCHHMDLSFWALGLKTPSTVEVIDGPKPHPVSAPVRITVRYEFPGAPGRPPVRLTWYHGADNRPPRLREIGAGDWGGGNLFVGDKGFLVADYGRHRLLPENKFVGFVPPPKSIPDSLGHHKEWLQACKTGGPTTCNFDYSGALTETVLLGNVAFRSQSKLTWNAATLKAVGCPAADEFLQHRYRQGWSI